MRFARIVFVGAGVWGIVVLTPLYLLLDVTGRQYVGVLFIAAFVKTRLPTRNDL